MAEEQSLVSSSLEITASDQSPADVARYLEAANWCLQDALELFLSGAIVGDHAASGDNDTRTPADREHSSDHDDQEKQEDNDDEDDELHDEYADDEGEQEDTDDEDYELPEEYADGVGAPAPVRRSLWSYYSELIADSNAVFTRRLQQDGAVSTVAGCLREMFPPPADMVFRGTFNDAKDAGARMDQWLLVNVQSGRDQSSSLLNRDVWSDDVLAYLIKDKFVFWQADQAWPEGQKVCTYYKQDLLPAILVVDPITGKMMRAWRGVVAPVDLLEHLLPLSRQSPMEHLFATSRKRPFEAEETPPPPPPNDASGIRELSQMYERLGLAKEPVQDGEGTCRVGVRLPDGRRIQRRFLQSDSIRMLWSFCLQHFDESAGDVARGFHFILAAPGNSKRLDYDSDLSFEEADLSNALISLVWD